MFGALDYCICNLGFVCDRIFCFMRKKKESLLACLRDGSEDVRGEGPADSPYAEIVTFSEERHIHYLPQSPRIRSLFPTASGQC